MNDTLPAERRCSLEEVFEVSFIELLRLVPANPYVRALVLKFSGKLPPAECIAFEQLKDWVEFNCVKRIKSKTPRSTDDGGIEISVDFTETEYGRADYSVERSDRENFHVDAGELMEIIQEAIADGKGIDEVVEVIAGKIDHDAWEECEPALDNYGDYDYSDHDSTDSDNSKLDYSTSEIRDAVLRFIRERHPELAAEL